MHTKGKGNLSGVRFKYNTVIQGYGQPLYLYLPSNMDIFLVAVVDEI